MEETLEAYRDYLVNGEKSKATVDKYLRDTRKFLNYLKTTDNGQITKEHVMEYKNSLMVSYLPSSVNSMLAALNSYLACLDRTECKVKLLKIQRSVFYDRSRQLERDEYIKLVKEARKKDNERLALIMEAMCSTGIRISELSCITVEAVLAGYAFVSLKGKERVILIPDKLKQKILSFCREHGIKTGSAFISRQGNPVNRSNVWREMRHLCASCGVSAEKVFPHNMRHLFARTYYKKQKDIVHLADLLGHSSIETTRIYTKTSSREYERQINEMELIF